MAIDRPRNSRGQFTTNNGAWFKNAAKSLGYAGIDLLKETMPALTETIDINKEFVTDIATTLRNNRNKNGKYNIKQHLTGKALENWNDAEEYLRNARADLKSGQFYNKERIQHTADEFGLDDFDFGDDFDLSDELDDSKFNDESVKVVVPNVNITSNINKDNPMVKAVQQQSKMMADVETAATKRQITIAEAQMKLDKDLAGVLYGGMETINTNLSNIITFNNDHMSGYIGASLKYYEENIRYMADISNSLKLISDMIERNNEPENVHPLEQITTYSGALNLSEYTKLVKKQLRNTLDEDMLMGSIMSMLESDGIKALAQSPLTFIPQMVLTKMVPDFLTKTFKGFDESFKAFVPALLNKMGSWADDASNDLMSAFKGFIGSVFGIKNVGKDTINPAMYEKGVVPFDGVTRKSIVEVIPGYLSKILSALTGKEELIFDSDQGKFIARSQLKGEYDKQVRRAAVSGFDAADDLKARVGAYGLESDEEERLKEHIDDLLVALSKRKKSFNPHKNGTKDDLEEILGDRVSPNELGIIRSLILSLDRSQIQNLSGAGHINARRNVTKLMENYEKTGNMLGMAQVNGLYDSDADYLSNNPLIKATKVYPNSSSNESKIIGSIFTPSDEYGKNSLNYLRDIYKTLLEGIGVWSVDPVNGRLSNFNKYENENNRTISRYSDNNPRSYTNLTPEEIAKMEAQGIKHFRDISNVTGETEEQVEFIRNYMNKRDGNITAEQKNPNHFSKLIKYLFGTNEEKQQIVDDTVGGWKTSLKNAFTAVDESMYKLVFGTNSVGYEKNTKKGLLSSMTTNFKIWLFGEKDEEGKSIGGIFNKFNTFLVEKIYNPIKDAFIGKDGIITKFKQSEMYKKIVQGAKNARDKLFGVAGENGIRSGGKLSNMYNSTVSYFKGTRLSDIRYNATTGYYVNNKTNEVITDPKIIEQLQNYSKDFKWDENVKAGKRIDDGVFGNIKSIGIGFRDSLKEWLFGSDTDKTKENAKGLLSDVTDYFKQGLQGFTDLIFGQHFDKDKNEVVSNKTVDTLINEIKAKSPKAIASGIVGGGIGLLAGAGGFGILGSLFLGPMSGVVIGTATGFLSQSDKFKNWLFGKEDTETGKHIEGFISKSTQEFFKKHKGAMIGGAALGMLKGITGIGILPSFILGGPLTGALFGLGTSLLTRSETFQNMLFGKDDGEGNKTDGLVNKVTNKLNNDSIKKKLGFGAAGAGLGAILGGTLSSFGILGSIAFGPLSGALLGAAAGITMAASKWSDTIFGTFDKDGNRKEQSILTKMMNAVTLNVLEPAKIQVMEWSYNVQDWFAEHIAEPFMDSVEPLKEEIRRLKDRIVGFATSVLDKLHITDLFEDIADGVKTGFNKVVSLVGDVGKAAFNTITKFTGFVLSSPVKLIHFIADKIIMPKHMREGIEQVRDKIIDNIKSSKFVQGINDHVIEPFKGSILEITDFAKDKVRKLFGGIWTGIKLLGQGLFKVVSAPFKGVKFISNGIKGLFDTSDVVRDTDRLNDIMSGENRGFIQSLRDYGSLLNPFSSLRSAAKHSKDGAWYQDDREAARQQRKAERDAKRKEHQEKIKELREQLDGRRERAKAFGYNTDGSDIDVDKIQNKEYRSKYGKDYKNMSNMEKDKFKESKAVNKTIFNMGDFLRDILDILRGKGGGVKVNDHNPDNSNDQSATVNINDDGTTSNPDDDTNVEELENENINNKPSKKKSKKERDAERKAERERLKEKGIFHSTGKWFKNKFHSIGDSLQRGVTIPGYGMIKLRSLSDDDNNDEPLPFGGEYKSIYNKFHTSGETEFEDKKQRKEEADKEKQLSMIEKLTNLTEIGNKDRKEHSSVWSSIFSKKGLITGGLLLLIPLLMKFIKNLPQSVKDLFASLFGGNGNTNNENGMDYEPKEGEGLGSILINKGKEFFGIQDTNGDRTSASGDTQINSDAIEAATIGGIRIGDKVINAGKSAVNATKSAIGTAKAVTSLIKGNTGKYEDTSVKSVVKTLTGKGNDKTDYKAKYLADDDSLSIIKRFANFLDEAVEAISKALKKKFPKIANNTVVNTIGKAFKSVLKTPSKLLNWVDDIAKGFGKAAAVITSGHTLDLVLGGYGAISGFTASETANLFNVSQKDINPTMRAASSILKGILNLGWGWAIQLGSDISVALGGPDIVKMLATLLYTLLSGADADKASTLLKAQQDFDTEYAEYVKTQEYLKGNAELMVGTDGKTEIIINDESKIKESKDSYNDRTNKSLADKLFGGIGSAWDSTKKFFVGQIGNAEEYDKTKTQLNQLEELATSGAVDPKSELYKTTKKSLEDALKKYETKNGLFKNNTKTTKSTPIVNYVNTSNTAKAIPVGGVGGSIEEFTDVDLTSNSANAKTFNSFTKTSNNNEDDIMSPLLSSFKSYKDVIKDLQNYIKSTVTNTVNKLLQNDINTNNININRNDKLGSVKEIIFYGAKALTMPVYAPFKTAKLAAEKISNMLKGMNDIPSFITKTTNISTLTKYNYWTNGKPYGTGIVNNLKQAIFQIGRGLLSPLFYLNETLETVSNQSKTSNNKTSLTLSSTTSTSSTSKDTSAYWSNVGGGIPGVGGAEEYDMLSSYRVSSKYGQYRTIEGKTGFHRGVDLYKGVNSPIYSFTDGIVDKVVSGYAPNSGRYGSTDGQGFGNWVRVKDSAGAYHHYAHMNDVNVAEGTRVKRGDQLGIEGHTGSSTGPHLHYEVREGGTSGTYHTDPYAYLKSYVAKIVEDIDHSNNTNSSSNDSDIIVNTNNITTAPRKARGLNGLTNAFSDIFNKLISPFSTFASNISNEFNKLLGFSEDEDDSNVSDTSDNSNDIYYNDSTTSDENNNNSSSTSSSNITAKNVSKNKVSDAIYTFFKSKGVSDAGIAGILGNLSVESDLKTNNLQDTFNSKFGLSDDAYTKAVNNGSYGDEKFINDGAGYGLAQWTYHSRKRALLQAAKARETGVDSIYAQLDHLNNELNSFGTFGAGLKDTNDVKFASDKMIRFLAPYDQSDKAKNLRASYAQGYYNLYHSGGGIGGSLDEIGTTPYLANYNKFNTTNSNFKRSISSILNAGNDNSTNSTLNSAIEYLKKIADGIMSIVDNTDNTNTKLDDIKNIEARKTKAQNNVAVIDNSEKQSNSPMFDIASNRRSNLSNKEYQTAKLIASGG